MSTDGSAHDVTDKKLDPSAVDAVEKDGSDLQPRDEDGVLLSDEERRAAEVRIKRALDMRLMPTMIVIFILNYIDRIGITSARLKGLEQDLHLTDLQYETVIAIFCASYCPAQIPSNMLTQNFTGIALVRVAIGFPEELSFRSAILYGGLLISNAFGSGAVTVSQVRLAEDAGEADEDSADESIWHGLKLALKDPKVPLFALMSCSQLVGLSFINFFPTPPWIWATIICCVTAWSADKSGERFVHVSGWWWGVIIGYIIALSTMSVGGRYVSLFLMASGYTGFALTLVWVSNAIPRPPAKRSIAMGIVNGFGNIGNLIGSFVWKAEWSPEYHQSMIIGICSLALACSLAFVIRCILIRENRELAETEIKKISPAERERVEEAARLEGITFDEAMKRKQGFRYLY
ncbi:MFS general substrate transporter [Gloeophyllum trabeum ATCC 11539]|uniref:MFS general substrate transporter n=1 Tax=Gloeophyllum trabeum (strain ATCC 11539 / FP-39264 / Madison 617) TaxID=670483 RepID=S7RKZ6_GLOTA|nr:MFS general substrate transporter [Gloeophyllum trabeum ATCC 11539]EPQ55025.1 MFS general substrate transporter [Gloeophyllum trabeum ATCC 11539]